MNNRTALGCAASGGHAEVVRLLLKHGAKPNLAEVGGHTPLMHAALSGSAEAASALISAGARLDVADEEGGWTALMWAAMRGRLPVVKVLCEAGAKTELKDKKKQTALQLAQANKRTAVAKYLTTA
jgi:ankyrin repeat protein